MTFATRCLASIAAVFTMLVPLAAAAQSDASNALPAVASAEPGDRTLSPYFFVEGDPTLDRLPLKDTRVDVTIAGVIADATVHQIYENRGTRPIHACYVFPASTRAAVYGMSMTVGNVRIVARIKEREQARTEFETARREGKSASLLEQSRPNVFTMNVANVLPGDTISVELKYTELLVATEGAYEFVYPTVVGPRYSEKGARGAAAHETFVNVPYTHQGEDPRSQFHLRGSLSTGVPIQDLASPSHRLLSRSTGPGRAEIALAESEQWSGNRDFILRYRLAGREVASGLLLYQGPTENFFLLLAEPPQAVTPEAMPAREYVFVVDVSGSMSGFPLDTAKVLMRDLANTLRPADTFNVVVFADGTETFSPVSVPATGDNLARALRFIGAKRGGGGTRLLSALQRAVAIPRHSDVSRSVVLVTDGYIDAESDVFDYVRTQLHAANFFAFGIGSSVNRFLIEGVARTGLGEPFVVTEPGEGPAAATRFRRYIDSPVLTDIKVSFLGFDAYDVEPEKIPDLFASRPIVVFGKWRGDARGSIEISGKSGRGVYQTALAVTPEVARAGDGERHAALRYLWARTRIANLSDFGPETPSDERVAEITSLGLIYGLLTRYTSFIAVRELVRNTTGSADDVDQPLPLPAGVWDSAIGVTSGAEPDIVWIAAIVVALLAVVSIARARRQRTGGLA